MGTLKCGNVDFNDSIVVQGFRQSVQALLDSSDIYYDLAHTKKYYFSVPHGRLPSERGWYIILNGKSPVYVGKAVDLNKRLNTENGSRDQFANPQRTSDIERNFIKRYAELNIMNELRVCILTESALFPGTELTDLDRSGVEKNLNIWRATFKYR